MTHTTQAPITEQQSSVKQAFVGLQMLFVAFGALVLVPLITGLDANKSQSSWHLLLLLLRRSNTASPLGGFLSPWAA